MSCRHTLNYCVSDECTCKHTCVCCSVVTTHEECMHVADLQRAVMCLRGCLHMSHTPPCVLPVLPAAHRLDYGLTSLRFPHMRLQLHGFVKASPVPIEVRELAVTTLSMACVVRVTTPVCDSWTDPLLVTQHRSH